MTSLASIRAGMATRIATVPTLLGRSHSLFPDRFTTPCAVVNIPRWTYHQSSGGLSRVEVEVLILAAPLGKGVERAQQALDAYLLDTGAESVKAAIEADATLGGVVSDCIVTGWTDYGEVEINGQSYLGATLAVTVAT